MKNRRKYTICGEIVLIALFFTLSLIGMHYVITGIFNFATQDSLIILVPVFLISVPTIVYGYYIGLRRHLLSSNDTQHMTKIGVLSSCFNISLVFVFTLIGLYLVIIEKRFAFGMVISLIGAIASVPISKKLYESLE